MLSADSFVFLSNRDAFYPLISLLIMVWIFLILGILFSLGAGYILP